MTAQIITFPDTPLARLRRGLRNVHSQRMLDGWTTAFSKDRDKLDRSDMYKLAAEAAAVHLRLANEARS